MKILSSVEKPKEQLGFQIQCDDLPHSSKEINLSMFNDAAFLYMVGNMARQCSNTSPFINTFVYALGHFETNVPLRVKELVLVVSDSKNSKNNEFDLSRFCEVLELNISHYSFSPQSIILKDFEHLSNLRKINFDSVEITDLSCWQNLEEVTLKNCSNLTTLGIRNVRHLSIENCPLLEHFDGGVVNISGSQSIFPAMTHIELLFTSDSRIVQFPVNISQLFPNLRSLKIYFSPIQFQVQNLSNLEVLHLIESVLIDDVSGLFNLRQFHLQCSLHLLCPLDQGLADLTSLTELNLDGIFQDPKRIEQFIRTSTSLEELTMANTNICFDFISFDNLKNVIIYDHTFPREFFLVKNPSFSNLKKISLGFIDGIQILHFPSSVVEISILHGLDLLEIIIDGSTTQRLPPVQVLTIRNCENFYRLESYRPIKNGLIEDCDMLREIDAIYGIDRLIIGKIHMNFKPVIKAK